MTEKEELIRKWQETGLVKDKRLIEAFKKIKREKFVLKDNLSHAYGDYPLPILGGQTISQPSTIMLMLEALELKETDKVLEIGAGSGYNAALIATVCSKGFVYSTEIVEELIDFAKSNLKNAGINNVEIIHSDGSEGFKKGAPYDKIVATCACPEIPELWLDQLKLGGIIAAPVGPMYAQEMVRLKKTKDRLDIKTLGDFMFVPLKGRHGYE